MPKVSVITPVYNCEKYIISSINSVLGQGFRDFELIIINDGSTDETPNIIKSFENSKIRFFDLGQNKGIPVARNFGINQAKGEYIAIHDGDDISESDRFLEQVQFLDAHPEIFCVGSWATKIDEESKIIDEMIYPPPDHKEIYKMFFGRICPIIDPSTMFRKSDFIELSCYNETDKYAHFVPDLDLWFRALVKGKMFANLTKKLISYRINPKGMTNLYKPKMIEAHVRIQAKYASFLLGGDRLFTKLL